MAFAEFKRCTLLLLALVCSMGSGDRVARIKCLAENCVCSDPDEVVVLDRVDLLNTTRNTSLTISQCVRLTLRTNATHDLARLSSLTLADIQILHLERDWNSGFNLRFKFLNLENIGELTADGSLIHPNASIRYNYSVNLVNVSWSTVAKSSLASKNRIQQIAIQNCNLGTLESGAFDVLYSREVRLIGNRLTKIERDAFRITQIATLKFQDNSIKEILPSALGFSVNRAEFTGNHVERNDRDIFSQVRVYNTRNSPEFLVKDNYFSCRFSPFNFTPVAEFNNIFSNGQEDDYFGIIVASTAVGAVVLILSIIGCIYVNFLKKKYSHQY